MVLKHKYLFSKHNDISIDIRLSEQEFHKSHAPLYANYMFCNSFAMSKIENYLINDCPEGTNIKIFDDMPVNQSKRLNNGALTCGMELINGKVNFEANYKIAKHSRNAFVYALNSINDDDLILVRDESLSDNTFILKYLPDNDDGDDKETTFSPDEKRIYVTA